MSGAQGERSGNRRTLCCFQYSQLFCHVFQKVLKLARSSPGSPQPRLCEPPCWLDHCVCTHARETRTDGPDESAYLGDHNRHAGEVRLDKLLDVPIDDVSKSHDECDASRLTRRSSP